MAGNPDLFGDHDDETGDGERAPSPFSGGKADQVRAAIGRPRGARNKKSVDFERWYHAMGYVDPAQKLAELISEDPRVLAAWLDEHAGADSQGNKRVGPTVLEVVNMQIRAAGELMPYLHGKKPTEVVVTDERLPILVVASGTNQMAEAAKLIEGRAVLSIGRPDGDQGEGEKARNSGVSEDEE